MKKTRACLPLAAALLLCAYAGAAWDGSLLWLRQDGGWHAYTIPGAEQPART